MKRILLIGLGAVVLVAIILGSLRAGRGDRGAKVYASKAERRAVSRVVKASGQIDPRVKVNLSAHVVGKIEKLYVEEGDEIEAGAAFLELEKDAFLALRNGAAAQREIQRARLRQAEIALADARLKLDRMRRLSAEKISSPEQLEAAELQYSSEQQSLEQAQQALAQATADYTKAQDDLSKTTIYSPLSGRVIALNAEQGEVVVSGTMNNPGSVIGTIADLSEILAEVDVDENEIVHVRENQSAKVKVDALGDHVYPGRVVEIGSSGYSKPSQPDVTFFKVKVLLDQPDESLRPGMSARADIETETKADALAVPIQAVVDRLPLDAAKTPPGTPKPDEVDTVFVVVAGKVEQRAVQTGLSDASWVELVSGVAEGDSVVSGPYRSLKALKDKAAVRVVDEAEEEKKRTKDAEEAEDEGESDGD